MPCQSNKSIFLSPGLALRSHGSHLFSKFNHVEVGAQWAGNSKKKEEYFVLITEYIVS